MFFILAFSTATTTDLVLTTLTPTISFNRKSMSTQTKTTKIALNMS
jgi:hypothetical protein